MRKSIYFLMMFAGLVFTSCEPMEEIHEDVDARLENIAITGNVEYILTEEDYTEAEEDGGLGLNYANFNSVDQANELVPGLLSSLYPALGEGALANVTVDIYNPDVDVNDIIEYEVTPDEYEELGHRYPNFDNENEMIAFLQYKYPSPSAGDAVALTYDYYAGETTTRTTTYVYAADAWMEALLLNEEDYTNMGESYPNFSYREDAIADLSIYLNKNYPYALEDDKMAIIYDLHIGGGDTVKKVEVFTFDGVSWGAPGELVQTTLQFGHSGTSWEPDNTIVYTLTAADYDNGSYANFNYWDEEDIQIAMDRILIVLEEKFPNVEEGQKFLVNYVGYSGSTINYSVNVIFRDGEFVIVE